MIHRVFANQPSFHPVEFTAGLNVVLADTTTVSNEKDTRNGLGKSTLLAIIDFCLGASASRGRGLLIAPLQEWTFSLDVTVAGNRVVVTRSIAVPGAVHVQGPTAGWALQPDHDNTLSVEAWRTILGAAYFDLDGRERAHPYHPTLRSVLPYFLRQGLDAYVSPFRHFRVQPAWNIQLNVAFLLGLRWENAGRWQELRDDAQAIQAVGAAIKTGAMGFVHGTMGELEAEVISIQTQVDRDQAALQGFKVHPQYTALQVEADQFTAELHELSNLNVRDRRRLAQYRGAITEETAPADATLENVYEEAGAVFQAPLRRSLEEAREFHRAIVSNRRQFLEVEVARIEQEMTERDARIGELTEQRAAILSVLSTHGALEELTALQERQLALKQRLTEVQSRLTHVRDLGTRRREITRQKAELLAVAARDHEERRPYWSEALRLFNENSQALYNTPGRLVIDLGDSGYKFDVEIERSGSEGVGKMKVFCFDLMLLELQRREGRNMDFLVHDSVLFDGVDARQRALALAHAASVTERLDSQYICALNSDMVPYDDFPSGFNFNQHIRLTLTDRDPRDRLLGFEFG